MIAVQIAALVVTSRGSLDSTSVAQVQINYSFLQSIAAGGYLPVTFNLLCLRQHGKRSWYIFLLSLSTFGLSASTLFGTKKLNPDGIISSNQLSECGNIDLTSLCSLTLISNYPVYVGPGYGNIRYSEWDYEESGYAFGESAYSGFDTNGYEYGGSDTGYSSFSFAAVMMFLLTIDQFDFSVHQRAVQKLVQSKAWCERSIEKGKRLISWSRIKRGFLITISETHNLLATHAAYRRTTQTMAWARTKMWCYIQPWFEVAFGQNNRFACWVRIKVRGLCSKNAKEIFDAGLKLIEGIIYIMVVLFYI